MRILHVAALGGHLDIVKLLVELGADVSAKTDSGLTALDYARIQEQEEYYAPVMEFLAEVAQRPT